MNKQTHKKVKKCSKTTTKLNFNFLIMRHKINWARSALLTTGSEQPGA